MGQTQDRAASPAAEVLQGAATARREDGDGAEQVAQHLGAVGIKGAPSPTAQTGNGAQGLFRLWITSLLEDEDRQPQEAKLAGEFGEPRRLFFHGIADQDQGIHLAVLTLLQGMFQDAPDLRQTRRA